MAEPSSSLASYEQKRDFSRTPEPAPAAVNRSGPLTFTIQKHAARRLHYDLRLEIDGVLVSWPIPKGPSYDPSARRLAIQTEDHPYDYGTFEGGIPKGEYGGGEVIVWDAGTYTIIEEGELPTFRDRALAERRAREGLERGRLRVFLNGRKLKGGWLLTRTRGQGTRSQWLFIKRRDGYEDPARDVTLEDRSVLSGLRLEDLKAGLAPPQTRSASLRPTADGVAGARRAPFPRPFEPMLPTLTETLFQRGDWLYEPKLDGYRVLAFVDNGQVQLRSRGGQEYASQFPGLVRALAGQPIDAAVFDGEVVALGPDKRMSFQRLQNRGADPATTVSFYVFDVLHLDGFELFGVQLADRKPLLHAVLAAVGGLQEVTTFDDGLNLFQAAEDNALEGIVAKKRDSVYEPGRRVRTWLKIKTSRTDEFVIAGYTRGAGQRADTLGSLILGTHDAEGRLRYAGHVGTGFNARSLKQVLERLRPLRRATSPLSERIPRGAAANWVDPEVVAEVKFSERTTDGRLRHPVFLRLRDDKPARDAQPQVLAEAPQSDSSTSRR